MKAALINRYGSNDAVSVADIDIPTLGATDLLVRVHAASASAVICAVPTEAPNLSLKLR